MTEPASHRVDPSDEGRHTPEADPLWNESHYLDFVDGDGRLAGYARIGLYPNLGVTWWTTMIVGPDRPLVASVAFDLPVADGTGLDLTAAGHDVHGSVEAPLATLCLHGSAPAVRHADPVAVYRRQPGDPVDLAFDLTWHTDGVPYQYEVTTRYEIPCLVDGSVAVDGEELTVSGQGQRDHSWGVRDWWAFGWCWAAARLNDGTRLHLADIRIPGMSVALGYVQRDGRIGTVGRLDVNEVCDADGLPTLAHAAVGPQGIRTTIEPVAFGPVLLEGPDGRTSRFPRAYARFRTDDGRSGTGWIEWNQPESEEPGGPPTAPAPDG